MGFFSDRYTKVGPGIPKDAPRKKGVKLFFEILWQEIFELFKLNLLFLLFCIPIVTIPAAMTAMSRITVTMARDRNHFLWTDFIKCFRAEFGRSTIAGFLLFAGIGVGGFGTWFYSAAAADSNQFFLVPMGLSACAVFILILMSFYLFPMLALINLPLKQIFKNALLLTFVCFPHNLAAFVINGVILFLFVGFLPVSSPLTFLWLFALLNFISTFCAYAGMRKYVVQDTEET